MKRQKVINCYKPVGMTPLECVQKIKEIKPELKTKKIGYAGRLDPMAEGVLILLVEPETKKRNKYQNLDKEYIAEILFGVETDTYDTLGKVEKKPRLPQAIQNGNKGKNIIPSLSDITAVLTMFLGKYKQKFPPYSSKVVNGKPLYWWARNKRINEISIPEKEIEIYSINLVKTYEKKSSQLHKEIIHNINKVSGDFRQNDIISSWNKYFQSIDKDSLLIAKIRIRCSSGTYVRSIASAVGNEIGCGAIAASIKRIRVGNHDIVDALKFD